MASERPTHSTDTSTDIPTFYAKCRYSAAAQQTQAPKRNQGLIMDCVDGLNLTDYMCAIGYIVQPKNVIFASRISNNRVCIYLATKELVTELTDKHETIVIKNLTITLRPLISKLKRVIFSNVSPDIPNYVLEDMLEELNVQCGSRISYVRASASMEEYKHVGSFRRQAYLKPEDIAKIPMTFKINFDDINYFIYVSTDSLRCFTCKLEGHLAKNCKNNTDSLNTHTIMTQSTNNTLVESPAEFREPSYTLNSNKTPANFSTIQNPVIPETNQGTSNPQQTAILSNNIPQQMETINPTDPLNLHTILNLDKNKRTHSQISGSTDPQKNLNVKKSNTVNPSTVNEDINKSANPLTLPPNTEDLETTLDEMDKKLISLKIYLNKGITHLNYTQFKSLLENLKGNKLPMSTILNYTNDLPALTKFLEEDVYPNVRNSGIKRRCTSILKVIKGTSINITPDQTPDNSDMET